MNQSKNKEVAKEMKRKKMMGMLLTAAMVTGSMASAFTCMAADEKPYDGVNLSIMIENGTDEKCTP